MNPTKEQLQKLEMMKENVINTHMWNINDITFDIIETMWKYFRYNNNLNLVAPKYKQPEIPAVFMAKWRPVYNEVFLPLFTQFAMMPNGLIRMFSNKLQETDGLMIAKLDDLFLIAHMEFVSPKALRHNQDLINNANLENNVFGTTIWAHICA